MGQFVSCHYWEVKVRVAHTIILELIVIGVTQIAPSFKMEQNQNTFFSNTKYVVRTYDVNKVKAMETF